MSDHPTVEMYLNDEWTDITSYVYYRDKIEITRGQSGEGSRTDTSTCRMTLNNRDGRFSPRNPTGAYYGQIGRNTPIRVSVDGGLPYLNLPETGGYASTPDDDSIDLSGDLDIRIDLALDDWKRTGNVELCGRWGAGGKGSWLLYLFDGRPAIAWSTDGSDAFFVYLATSLSQPVHDRMALRVTLDVDNGDGNSELAAYTAPTIDGPWTALQDPFVNTGTISIASASTPLYVGANPDVTYLDPVGKCYAFQLRDGIDGTVVADIDFTAQTVDDTSFTDDASLTWTVGGDAALTNRKSRFTGEVSTWPVEWENSGKDVVTKIEASGILRRLTQGNSPLRSVAFRQFSNPERENIVAYWPMEDQEGSDTIASAIDGHPAMTFVGSPQLASSTSWTSSGALPAVRDATFTAAVPVYAVTGETSTRLLVQAPSNGIPDEGMLFSLDGTGTVKQWVVSINIVGNLQVKAYDQEGIELIPTDFISFALNGALANVTLETTQSGSDINWKISVADYTDVKTINSDIPGSSFTGTISDQTVGRISKVRIGGGTLGDTVIGHFTIADDLAAYTGTGPALVGLRDENAIDRLRRIFEDEEGIPLKIRSLDEDDNTVTMGTQDLQPLADLARECAETDLGILYEPRNEIALGYRNRISLYNQEPQLTLDYEQHQLSGPPIPVDDDRYTRNDITVSRRNGSKKQAVLDTGPLSVQDPPDGVGRYEESVTISLGSDDQLPNQAGWRLHLGTIDEARYPKIELNLRHSTFTDDVDMMEAALELDCGDRVVITNPPDWLPPDDISLMAVGFTERLGVLERDITVNCIAESAYHVAYVEDTDYGRADTDGCALTGALTSAATSVTVTTDVDSALWTTDSDEMPFDVRAGGEVMTVSGIANSVTDTFARSTSSGWGTADIGGSWTTSGGTASNYSTSGSYGAVVHASLDVARITTLTAQGPDVDMYVDVATNALATGAAIYGGPCARLSSNSNWYMARVQFSTTQAIRLTIRKRVSNTETELVGVDTGLTHVAGTFYRVRFQVFGSSLKAKIWNPATASEPGQWHLSTTDTSHTAANSIGTRSYASVGNTNTNPETWYDNFKIVNPQIMTVTRSVNGVTKSHTAGTDIRLADPAIISL